jgi:choline kinase
MAEAQYRNSIVTTKLPHKNKKYSIIIPTAGKGTRMTSYGAKSLIDLSPRRTILSRQLSIIHKIFNNPDIILVTGYEHQRVIDNTPSYITKVINSRYEDTNVAYSIGLGLEVAKTNRAVIIYGDLVFNKELLQCPFSQDSIAVLCNTMQDNEVGVILENHNYIEEMFYGYPQKWAQILYLTNRELEIFKSLCLRPQFHKSYGFEIINQTIRYKGCIKGFTPPKAKVVDVDTSKDLDLAQQII